MEVQRVFFIVKFEAKAKTIFEKKSLMLKAIKPCRFHYIFMKCFVNYEMCVFFGDFFIS